MNDTRFSSEWSDGEKLHTALMTAPESDAPFTVIAMGLLYASVCTSWADPAASVALNITHPTGLDRRDWVLTDEDFQSGERNGCPCETRPDTHRHFLFTVGEAS